MNKLTKEFRFLGYLIHMSLLPPRLSIDVSLRKLQRVTHRRSMLTTNNDISYHDLSQPNQSYLHPAISLFQKVFKPPQYAARVHPLHHS